jgi:hypothetical protein
MLPCLCASLLIGEEWRTETRREDRMGKYRGGVYVYRTRKPGAIFGLPIIGRHFAYAGESNNFGRRDREHLIGSNMYEFAVKRKPWCDLDPKCYRFPLPPWKWLLRSVETLLILLTWPVYNDRKNRWNPRRISIPVQHLQRKMRDKASESNNILIGFMRYVVTLRPIHGLMMLIVALAPTVAWNVWR